MAGSGMLVRNETGLLRHVVVGQSNTFGAHAPVIPTNPTTIRNMKYGLLPTIPELKKEYESLISALEREGVRVSVVEPIVTSSHPVPEQLFPRDIAVVIQSEILHCNMREESRVGEWSGLEPILRQEAIRQESIVTLPEEQLIEGGDVVVDKGHIFVGIGGARSKRESLNGLQACFPNFQVVGLELAAGKGVPEVLHLDCTFVPIGMDSAVVCWEGFKKPAEIRDLLTNLYPGGFIEVSKEEQSFLATNVLSLSPQKLIARSAAVITNQKLLDKGFQVIEVDFDAAPKVGGAIRCATLPLFRDSE